jgi:hypothetical protein
MSKEMREQIDRVKNWKQFLNEEVNNLPNYINIDDELNKLKNFDLELDKLNFLDTEKKNINKINNIINKKSDVEDIIKDKLWDTLLKYLEKGDYEGAKKFVGKSYGNMNTPGKILLFRSILVHQKQNED